MEREQAVSDRVLTIPNALSILRLVLVPTFAVLLFTERDAIAVAVLMISGATDYFDGKLARSWGQVSRLGQVLDPAVDRLYVFTTLLALAFRDVIPWWLVAALIARDALLVLALPVLATYGFRPLPVSFLGKAATFNLLFAFPLLLLAAAIDGTAADLARAAGWAFTWWGVALYWWSALVYIVQVRDAVRVAQTDRNQRADRNQQADRNPRPDRRSQADRGPEGGGWNDGRSWPTP